MEVERRNFEWRISLVLSPVKVRKIESFHSLFLMASGGHLEETDYKSKQRLV